MPLTDAEIAALWETLAADDLDSPALSEVDEDELREMVEEARR